MARTKRIIRRGNQGPNVRRNKPATERKRLSKKEVGKLIAQVEANHPALAERLRKYLAGWEGFPAEEAGAGTISFFQSEESLSIVEDGTEVLGDGDESLRIFLTALLEGIQGELEE